MHTLLGNAVPYEVASLYLSVHCSCGHEGHNNTIGPRHMPTSFLPRKLSSF